MERVLNAGVTGVAVLMMVTVGLNLETRHFSEVARRKGLFFSLLIVPVVVLPALGFLLVRLLNLPADLSAGILLVVACPVGDIANFYTVLARGNAALAVTVNTLSCMLSAVTMSLIFAVYEVLLHLPFEFVVPTPALVLRITLLAALPVLVGMALRRFKPAFAVGSAKTFRNASLAGVVFVLASIFVSQRARLAEEWQPAVVAAAAFIPLALFCGLVFGRMFRLNARDTFTAGVLFAVRNAGLPMAIAVTMLHRVEYAVFAAVYFLTEVPLLLAVVAAYRFGVAKAAMPLKSGPSAAITP